ncbi:MAG: Gfo/Idh/MocA family oxidoreductase, partial [Firmicutes bacterium]|nr:Gfo/Idh/MocA family oxidoreductase [Bacillota bacterium]
MQDVVTLAIVGAGNRGADVYARYAREHPNEARVVAVAAPARARRDALGDAHGIPPEHRYSSWQALLERPRLADAVVIATPDRLHVEPALRAIELGYDILLAKPLAPTAAGVRRGAEADRRA